MPLNQKNPILTDSWKRLKEHFNYISKQKIEDHFQKINIGVRNYTNFNKFFDYSKNKINKETIKLFNDLLTEINFSDSVKKYLTEITLTKLSLVGTTLSITSKRNRRDFVEGENIFLKFYFQEKMMDFSDQVLGSYKGIQKLKLQIL